MNTTKCQPTTKSQPTIVRPIFSLSEREVEVLQLVVAAGLTNKEIASELRIGIRTVETHRERVNDKIRAFTGNGRVSVAAWTRVALDQGLMRSDMIGRHINLENIQEALETPPNDAPGPTLAGNSAENLADQLQSLSTFIRSRHGLQVLATPRAVAAC